MTLPGPGDPATWPAPTGHPNDPRTPDTGDCPNCVEQMIDPDGCAACGWEPDPDELTAAEHDALEDRIYGGHR